MSTKKERDRQEAERLATYHASLERDIPRCEECGAELMTPVRFCPECSQARQEASL